MRRAASPAIALLVLAAFAAEPAGAAPRDDVHAAYAKFLGQKSFRATLTDAANGEKISDLAFVAPDRYRVQSTRGPEMTLIGEDGWMNMNGRSMKVPMPVGKIISQYRNDKTIAQLDKAEVTQVGSDSIDGQAAHVYHYVLTEPVKADVKLWIGDKSGLPLQLESQGSFMGKASTTRIRYLDFNDPAIRVDPPE